MTFIFHPLSHYNAITEPNARFFLSLIKDLSIDFSSHFILSLIDVYKDTTTRDKLIFPSAITRLLRHFFVSYPESPYFTFMCATDASTIRWSATQFLLRQPRTETAAPNRDGSSYSFYYSIHLHSFIFSEWSDTWGHHGTTCMHRCSPWHSQWWVVLNEHPC